MKFLPSCFIESQLIDNELIRVAKYTFDTRTLKNSKQILYYWENFEIFDNNYM
jgi:hypothetical protein